MNLNGICKIAQQSSDLSYLLPRLSEVEAEVERSGFYSDDLDLERTIQHRESPISECPMYDSESELGYDAFCMPKFSSSCKVSQLYADVPALEQQAYLTPQPKQTHQYEFLDL